MPSVAQLLPTLLLGRINGKPATRLLNKNLENSIHE